MKTMLLITVMLAYMVLPTFAIEGDWQICKVSDPHNAQIKVLTFPSPKSTVLETLINDTFVFVLDHGTLDNKSLGLHCDPGRLCENKKDCWWLD
jgi:hypothetical protein